MLISFKERELQTEEIMQRVKVQSFSFEVNYYKLKDWLDRLSFEDFRAANFYSKPCGNDFNFVNDAMGLPFRPKH